MMRLGDSAALEGLATFQLREQQCVISTNGGEQDKT